MNIGSQLYAIKQEFARKSCWVHPVPAALNLRDLS